METTERDRVWLQQNWNADDPTFRQWVAGSDQAHALVPRLCRDVDRLVAALGKAVTDGQVECDTGGHGDRHSPPEPDDCLACLGYTILELKEENNGRPTGN